MTILEQANELKTALEGWATDNKVNVRIASDALHMLAMLEMTPGSIRAVILFDAEEIRGDIEELGRVDRRWIVAVSRGRGFKLDPGANLTSGTGTEKPLFTLAEECRETIRALTFDKASGDTVISGEKPVYYKATRRMEISGLVVDAYQVEFQLGAQLPIVNTPPG